MKKVLLFAVLFVAAVQVQAQNCSHLIISEYVHGNNNNRAIEVYNPTSSPVDLTNYYIGRYSNGAASLNADQIVELTTSPVTLQPYETFVVVTEKLDYVNGTGFEAPIWNGYETIDMNGDIVFNSNGEPERDSAVYTNENDLYSRADNFICPVYNVNQTLYHNGNDAMVLMDAPTPGASGENILDAVGVIGENPGDAWEDNNGNWMTRRATLVRKPSIQQGKVAVTGVDTFAYGDWEVFTSNTFVNLQSHDCVCDPSFVGANNVEVAAADFRIYPNPALNGFVTINGSESVERLTVTNTLGQQVRFMEFTNNATEQRVWLRNLEPGMYVLTAEFANGQMATQKLMIQ